MARTFTQAERRLLDGLTPHTRLHTLCLLGAHPDLRPTSGRRTAERNRAVGGVPGSFHLRGRAVDVVVPPNERSAFLRWVRADRATPRCTGPEEVLDEGDHIHIAW